MEEAASSAVVVTGVLAAAGAVAAMVVGEAVAEEEVTTIGDAAGPSATEVLPMTNFPTSVRNSRLTGPPTIAMQWIWTHRRAPQMLSNQT